MPFGKDLREGGENTVCHPRQHPVGQACHRVLFVQHQWFAQQDTHHASRKTDVATQADDHLGPDAAHHLDALPECFKQSQRSKGQSHQTLSPNAGKVDGFKGKSAWRHQLAFHAGGATQPVDPPASVAQRLGHRESRENMSPRATRHHESALVAAHGRPPRIRTRFS
jgi:hypothetical protein